MSNIYEDKPENKKYSGSGVFVETADDGTGVTSINGKDGSVIVTINNVNPQANLSLGISGSSIPVTSPSSQDDPVETIESAITNLKTDATNLFSNVNILAQADAALISEDIAINNKLNLKKSFDRLVVGQATTVFPNNNNSIGIDVGMESTTGLTADYDGGTAEFGNVELTTADCVPKKFIVQDKYQSGQTSEVIATADNPYKFISSDETISITVGDNAGEIDLKALDNPLDKNFTFSEPLTTLVSKMMIGWDASYAYFNNPFKTFDFTVKSTTDVSPETSDLYMIVYYSDYMERVPDGFPNGQGIFYIEGVPTASPESNPEEMIRIYVTTENRNGILKHDLNVVVKGSNQSGGMQMYNYRLNTDLDKTEYTGTKVKINLSEKWKNLGLSMKQASFNPYLSPKQPAAINPFDYSVVCGHIFFTFQYKE
jgi:hypothetical protein